MRIPFILLLVLTNVSFISSQEIILDPVIGGFEIPVDITHAGDDRLFIVEKTGAIKILLANGTVLPSPFIDLDPIVNSQANERGLLGLAFHPNYAANGFFFVYYTNASGATVVSRFSVTSDPYVADPSSEKIIFTTPQPFNNHNGGCIKFSPDDGFLYIGIGDGGSFGDPQDNGQDGLSYLGKILRIDINGMGAYDIPQSNPFIDDPMTRDEIWSTGWRNPWRFSFDRETHDMWVGDVGQNEWEEIDFESPGDGGRNYGWRCFEGNVQYNFKDCDAGDEFTFPVFVYANSSFNKGCSVTGGFVYRGQDYPSLFGSYIFADFCSGQFWTTRKSDCGFVTNENYRGERNEYSALGEDVNGELYVAALGEGRIYKITTECDLNITASITAPSCLGATDGRIDLEITASSAISSILWSTGVGTEDLTEVTEGEYTVTVTDANGCVSSRCFKLEAPEADPSCPDNFNSSTGCFDGFLVLTLPCNPPAGYMIRWFKDGQVIAGEDDANIQISEAGLYSVQFYSASCALGISHVFEYSIFPPEDAPNFVQDGNSLVADAGFFDYIWFLNGNEVQSGSSNTLQITEDGLYALQARNSLGCLTLISDEVNITLSSTLDVSSLDVFPNPFDDQCTIHMQLLQPKDIRINVIDSKGAVLYENTQTSSRALQLEIDMKSIASGLYMLRIEFENKQVIRKIIKL